MCVVLVCAEGALTKRQRPGRLAYGHSKMGTSVYVYAESPSRRLGLALLPAIFFHGRSGDPLALRLPVPGAPCRGLIMVRLGPAWTMHTTSLPCGSGQWNSCISLQHCFLARGNGSRNACCLLASGNAQGVCCLSLAHCVGAVGNRIPSGRPPRCLGATGSACVVTHCLFFGGGGAIGREIRAIHCRIALWQRAVDVLLLAASPPPHYLRAAGSGSSAPPCLMALGTRQQHSRNTLPHYLEAVGSAPCMWLATASMSAGSG